MGPDIVSGRNDGTEPHNKPIVIADGLGNRTACTLVRPAITSNNTIIDPRCAVVKPKTFALAYDAMGRLRPLRGAEVKMSTMRWCEGVY